MEQKIQNSGEPEAGSENTTAFRKTYDELVRIAERYAEFAQSTRQAYIRLLLTLSSGSLVASISLLRSSISADTVCLTLLPVSWGFLGISVFTCLLHFASNHSYAFEFSTLRVLIDEAEESMKESSFSDRVKAAKAFVDQIKQIEDDRGLKWEERQSVIALASFFLGLLTLIVFATKNLPWGS